MLLYDFSSVANPSEMAVEEKTASKLEPWQRDDAKRLRTMFDEYRKKGGLKQEEFAPTFGLKSQSNLGHYLHARRPLNLRAAIGFARGLKRAIEAFSPTIAAEIEEAAPLARDKPHSKTSAPWPFPSITPVDYFSLEPSERNFIEQSAMHALQRHQTMKLIHKKPSPEVETGNMPLASKKK